VISFFIFCHFILLFKWSTFRVATGSDIIHKYSDSNSDFNGYRYSDSDIYGYEYGYEYFFDGYGYEYGMKFETGCGYE
jgi:hypothetical protein